MSWLPHYHPGQQWLVSTILVLTGSISLLAILLFIWGPPLLPLWYSLTVSEEQLVPKIWVISVPALALAITAATLWFGRHTALDHEKYVAALSLGSGLALLTMLLIAFLRIAKVVL